MHRHSACTRPQEICAEVAVGKSQHTEESQSVERGVVGSPPVQLLHGGIMMTWGGIGGRGITGRVVVGVMTTRIKRKEKQGRARKGSKMGWVTQHDTMLGTKTHVNFSWLPTKALSQSMRSITGYVQTRSDIRTVSHLPLTCPVDPPASFPRRSPRHLLVNTTVCSTAWEQR